MAKKKIIGLELYDYGDRFVAGFLRDDNILRYYETRNEEAFTKLTVIAVILTMDYGWVYTITDDTFKLYNREFVTLLGIGGDEYV
ncbi:MAG: hypothetical protein QW734_08550 [Candidatus Bathyarchaeia archaeon]